MSFQEIGDASPSQSVAAGIVKIRTAILGFDCLVNSLCTPKDTFELRHKLHKTRLHIGQLVKETSAKLREASEADHDAEPLKKIADTKLAKDFQAALKDFQKAQRLAAEREIAYTPSVPKEVLPSSYDAYEVEKNSSESLEKQRLLVTKRQEVILMDNEITFNETIIEERDPVLEIEKLAEILEDFKMVLVVRKDLKMGKGKIAAQCSHATLGLYKKLLNRAPKALNRWEMCAQPKVVVKIDSEEDMLVLQERAKSLNIPTHITIDAGRTQIAPNSRTVMAIIGPIELVDDVTGGLKLL